MLNTGSREFALRSKVVHCVNIPLSAGLAHSVRLHQILNIEHAKTPKHIQPFTQSGELNLGTALLDVLRAKPITLRATLTSSDLVTKATSQHLLM